MREQRTLQAHSRREKERERDSEYSASAGRGNEIALSERCGTGEKKRTKGVYKGDVSNYCWVASKRDIGRECFKVRGVR